MGCVVVRSKELNDFKSTEDELAQVKCNHVVDDVTLRPCCISNSKHVLNQRHEKSEPFLEFHLFHFTFGERVDVLKLDLRIALLWLGLRCFFWFHRKWRGLFACLEFLFGSRFSLSESLLNFFVNFECFRLDAVFLWFLEGLLQLLMLNLLSSQNIRLQLVHFDLRPA